MCQELLRSASFHSHLLTIDEDLAAAACQGGCPHCGGSLHVANYPRQPRGFPDGIGGRAHDLRHSFCCGKDECRKRLTPVSVRFLERRVYSSVIVVLAVMMTQGPNSKRARVVAAELSVDRRTIECWIGWWRDHVPRTACWQALRGNLAGSVDADALPLSVYDVITGADDEERFVRLLHLFGDLSQTTLMRARSSRAA